MDTARQDTSPRIVNVPELISSHKLSGLSLILFGLLSLVLAADGFDLLVLGFTAPAIGKAFLLSTTRIGWMTMVSHSGVALGGILGGMFGDRRGRRVALIAGVAIFGAFGLLCSTAATYPVFLLTRVISCFGLGAVTPNVAAYLTDILPTRWRSRLTILTYTVSALGATACGLAARAWLPGSGWRVLFEAGGIGPLLLLPLLWMLLPESPIYLLAATGRNVELAKALGRLTGNVRFDGTETFVGAMASKERGALRALFGTAYLRDTLALWALCFAIMFSGIALSSMSTVVLTSAQVPMRTAVNALLAFNLCGVIGATLSAAGIRRLGSRLTMAALVITGVLGLMILARVLATHATDAKTVIGAMGICGFGLSGVLMLTYPLLAQAYPASIRSTGTGAALTFGRIGAVISAVVVAAALTRGGPPQALLLVAGIAALALPALLGVRRHMAAASREP